MKTLLAFLAILLCCAQVQAQSNQTFQQKSYWASDYGTWQVKGQSANNYQFSPASVCTVSPPNTTASFQPFATNAPVLILDALPSNTEVVTPTSIVSNASYCGIIAQPVHTHYSFSLLSATGGLQEALNQISSSIPYAAQVVLDRNWYESLRGIPGASAAAVIAAAKGNTAAYLVDNTTAPNTFYTWSGTQYVQVAPPGGLPTGTGLVKVQSSAGELAIPGTDYALPNSNTTGTAGNLSGTPTLPNGTKATTQTTSPCDNTTNLATDQFVVSCAGTASFPNIAGIVYNTSPSASRNATGSDLASLLGYAAQGDLIVGGTSGAPVRLPANSSSGQGVLVSTAAASTVVPTTKTCAAQSGASTNTETCTWSTAIAPGETAFCYVWSSTNATTFALTDAGGNTYGNYGAVHSGSTTSEYTQTFYAPITSGSAATTTVTASSGNFLGIQCDSASNIKSSSPTDGQAVVDSVGSPITSPTITTTTAGDYIFCGTIAGFGVTLGPGSGFTGGASFGGNGLNQYSLQGTAGAIVPTMFASVGGAASMTCSAFKAGTTVTPAQTAWQQNATLGTFTLGNVIAPNTSVLPVPPTPSGGDDYPALQNAINASIANGLCKEVYIPPGNWHSSQGLVANAECVKLRGDPRATVINFTGTGFNGITVGDGAGDQAMPTGYTFGFRLVGPGKSNAGFAGLQINGLTQYEVDSVTSDGWDIGFDAVNNNYGSQWTNIRACFNNPCNVGLNLRTGSQSGSDLAFNNDWIAGNICGVSVSPGGGGYHFYGGQIGTANTTSYNDNSGSVCIGKDYLTGSTSGGAAEADFYGTSFEDTNYGWVFRGFEQASIEAHYTSMNPSNCSVPGIGVYKNTNFQVGKLALYDTALSGCYNNTGAAGSPLIQISGIQGNQNAAYQGANIIEEGTYTSGTIPTIGGSSTYVQSMFAQSGLQNLATIIGMAGVSIPGNTYTTPLTLINNNSGALETSNSTGCFTGGTCVTQTIPTNPLTTLGDLLYGGSGGAFARLAGNTNPTDAVLVSHAAASANTPTTKTCTNSDPSSSFVTCTWSAAPAAGETVACGLFNINPSTTFAVTDSASDAYHLVGSPHNLTTITGTTQHAWFTLGTSITTTTVSNSSGGSLTLNCNTFTQPATSTDGQCTVDSTSSTTIPCGTAITTTQNGDYLFCNADNATVGDAFSVGSGFTAGASFNVNHFAQYQVQATAGAITPTVVSSGASPAAMTCTAFKANQAAQAPFLEALPYLTAAEFSGATPAEKINACGAALIAAGGGTCDASTLGASTQTGGHATPQNIDVQITWGATGGNVPMTLILPNLFFWVGTMTDGTSCDVLQYADTTIKTNNPAAALPSNAVFASATTSSLGALFCLSGTNSSSGNYVYDQGFQINNGQFSGTGAVTADNAALYINGGSAAFDDVTTFDHVIIGDKLDTYAVYGTGLCCSTTFRSIQINAFNVGTPLYLQAVSPTAISGVNIVDSSIVHNGNGVPLISISDTFNHNSVVNINNLYSEVYAVSGGLIQIAGAGSVSVTNSTFKAYTASMNSPWIEVSNAINTFLSTSNLNGINGSGSWSSPSAIVDNFTSQTLLPSHITGVYNLPLGNLPITIYSAAGTAIPTCTSALNGQKQTVSDATSPTFLGTYTSGGTVTAPVVCNGSNWITY